MTLDDPVMGTVYDGYNFYTISYDGRMNKWPAPPAINFPLASPRSPSPQPVFAGSEPSFASTSSSGAPSSSGTPEPQNRGRGFGPVDLLDNSDDEELRKAIPIPIGSLSFKC